MKQCYICERATDDWITADAIRFENQEIEEQIIEHYFVHCVGPKDMFTEDGGVVVCKKCADIIAKGIVVHICYNCKQPTMDFVTVPIPKNMSAFEVPGKYVNDEYKLVVCSNCVKVTKGLLRVKK